MRELPRMVQIAPKIDRTAGVLRISFPLESEIESFEIGLDPPAAEMAQWSMCASSSPHWQ
jgi:hypothetical protein